MLNTWCCSEHCHGSFNRMCPSNMSHVTFAFLDSSHIRQLAEREICFILRVSLPNQKIPKRKPCLVAVVSLFRTHASQKVTGTHEKCVTVVQEAIGVRLT
jgi:hypothetical protein